MAMEVDIIRKGDGSYMNNLQLMATVLSEVTGQPRGQWERCIRNAIAASGKDIIKDTKLLVELRPAEKRGLLRKLRQNKEGILAWLVQGSVAVRQRPEQLNSYRFHMQNMQN